MDFCRVALNHDRYITDGERAIAQRRVNAIALVNRSLTPSESILHRLTLSASETSALREDLREAQDRFRQAESANEATKLLDLSIHSAATSCTRLVRHLNQSSFSARHASQSVRLLCQSYLLPLNQ